MNIHVDAWDTLGLVGLALLILGLAWAWPPLVLIVLGAGLLSIAFVGADKWQSLNRSRKSSDAGDENDENDEV